MSKVEFIEETHTYVNSKGIIIPSTSQIIRFKFPDAYKGVPEEKLKAKASYGTKVHGLVEDFVRGKFTLDEIKSKKGLDPNIKIAVEEFERLRKEWCFYVDDMEQVVDYKERVAGQYDLLCGNTIVDIKTTNVVHEDWLKLQLGFYALMIGIDSTQHYCMWLPKGEPGKVIPIASLTNDECKEILKDYEKHNSN